MPVRVQFRRRLPNFSFAIILLLGLVASLPLFTPNVFAADETIVNSPNLSGIVADPIPVTGLFIDGVGNENITISLFVLSDENHEETGFLSFGSADGLTFLDEADNDDDEFKVASGLRNDINAALATLTYTAREPGTFTIQLTVGEYGTYHDPLTGHVYKVNTTELTWEEARDAAAAMTLGGSQGHLATITSQQEHNFIASWLDGMNMWMGASDLVSEGDWQWATELSGATTIWNNGPIEGVFENWYDGWPSDGDGNHCGVMSSGGWFAYDCNYSNYSIVEFDNPTGQAGGVSARFQVTTSVPTTYVSTCDELRAVDDKEDEDGYFDTFYANIELTADIDCEDQPFDPLFQYGGQDFRGSFDGNGHTIKNVVLNEGEDYTGIISNADWITATDLNLENITATGSGAVGSLAGYVGDSATIINVHARDVDLTANGNDYVGGLIGRLYSDNGQPVLIENVSVTGKIMMDGEDIDYVGGLIGRALIYDDLRMTKVSTDVTIDRTDLFEEEVYQRIGGVFGSLLAENGESDDALYDTDVIIEDVYSWGNITAGESNRVGGFAGQLTVENNGSNLNAKVQISRIYAKGDVAGKEQIGGLVGYIYGDDSNDAGEEPLIEINSSFALGKVTIIAGEEATVGAVFGEFIDDFTTYDYFVTENVFFDQTKATIDECSRNKVLVGCTPVNIDGSQPNYFIGNSTNAPFTAWDFQNVWMTHADTPPTFRTSPASVESGGSSLNTPQSNPYKQPSGGNRPLLVRYDLEDEEDTVVAQAVANSTTVTTFQNDSDDTSKETVKTITGLNPVLWIVGGSSLLVLAIIAYIVYRRTRMAV